MSAYREFTGKSVEEALRNAREAFGAGLDDLDFEILTPGSRGVLGMGAEPARIVAAPRSALGGAAPKRDAAASVPLPPPPPREDRGPRRDFPDRNDRGDRGPRPAGARDDRGPRRDDRAPERAPDRAPARTDDRGPRPAAPDRNPERYESPTQGPTAASARSGEAPPTPPRRADRGPSDGGRGDRGPRPSGPGRPDRGPRPGGDRGTRPSSGTRPEMTASEIAEVSAARGSLATERAELEAAEASPEALKAGQQILEELMKHLGFNVRVEVESGETSRLNVVGDGDEKEALGALIGRKGERLSALQHLVNLMLSRKMDAWTRVLVDVEDYRGRRERQLRELATRAAERVSETGKMLQLEPMPALERRWIHIALRDHPDVATQSIGEEPNRRVVVVPRAR
jgi:spoIIIJ-associated protein